MNFSIVQSPLAARDEARVCRNTFASAAPAVTLAKRQVWSVTLVAGARVEVQSGAVWLTISNDAEDYVLRAGESFTAPHRGHVVAQALEDSQLCLRDRGQQTKETLR